MTTAIRPVPALPVKKTEISRFHVDSGDNRSTREWREKIGLDERANEIST
jgi:hypothetical protein